jgi:integrase/recombinase XerD
MKVNRNGQAEILSRDRLGDLFNLMSGRRHSERNRYRLLFGICYFTGCRIAEAIQLKREDVGDRSITFRRTTTKTQKTRTVKVNAQLAQILDEVGLPEHGYLFPARDGDRHLTTRAADLILRKYCDYLGIKGVSTHSFRRTALTHMSSAGIPLRHIQEISGHSSLASLQKYLEVSEKDKEEAIAVLGW